MKFNEIHPFVRYARIVDSSVSNDMLKPYDCRLFYMLSGNAIIFADDAIYNLSPHDVLIINAGTKYRITTESDFEILAFNFDYTLESSDIALPVPPDSPDHFDEESIISLVSFSDYPEFNSVVYIENMETGIEFLFSAHSEYKKNLLLADSVSSAYLSQFLSMCLRKKEGSSAVNNSKANSIIAFVQQNISTNITNIEIAKKFNYHPNYINTIIRSETGMSLHKYLIHIRIRRAIELLETTDLPISEIASETGFCDISYFSNYFKKITGRAPKYYRKK